jgi:hypothetical protein
MGVLNQIKKAIMDHAAGSDWLAGMTGGIYPSGKIPPCAKITGPYAEFSWVGVKPDHTFTENNTEAWIQFQFWSDDESTVNDAIDGCIELFGNAPGRPNEIGGFFQMDELESLPAMTSDKTDPFSLITGMAQFRFKFTKTCT